MNASPKLTYIISTFAVATGLPLEATAQNYPSAPPVSYVPAPGLPETDLAHGVYLASIDAEDHSLRRYAGQRLYNTEGADLGTVRDFIVQPAASRIRYAVISTGGVLGGIGNTLRLVPFEVIRRGSRGNLFEVDILQAHWLQIPPVDDRDYVADRFVISPTLHQEMVQRYQSTGPLAVNPTGSEFLGLIRASVLRGKTIEVAQRKVGDVENIILDLDRGTAAALLDSSGDFTGTRAKYLVPLSRLAFTDPRNNPISTNLTRQEFEGARPGFLAPREMAAANQTRTPQGQALTPTGPVVVQVSPNQVPAHQAPVVHAPTPPPPAPVTVYQAPAPPPVPPVTVAPVPAQEPPASSLPNELVQDARAIRRAIDLDPQLVAENVLVIPDNGKIYLRGTVRNEATRLALENAAQRVVSRSPIDNQIVVSRP
jgi:sporulation protein YlmC with PRC-barrel domain